MWNQRDLIGPPLIGCKGFSKDLDFKLLKKTLTGAYNYFCTQDNFSTCIAHCDKIVKLKKSQFRQVKAYQEIKKTNTALQRYKSVNIVRIFENVLSFIPDYYEEKKTLPSKQYFEYVLVRLQGIVKILIRVIECSTSANKLLIGTITTAHFVELNTILIALMSQIWSLAKEICKSCAQIYNELYLLNEFLPNKNKWLPNDYVLPEKLEMWLGDDWKLVNITTSEESSSALTSDNELNNQDDNKINKQEKQEKNLLNFTSDYRERIAKVHKVIEIGEEIDRNIFKKIKLDGSNK